MTREGQCIPQSPYFSARGVRPEVCGVWNQLQVTWENTRAATAKIVLTFVNLGDLTKHAGAIRLSLVRPAFRIGVVYAIPRSTHDSAQPLMKRRVRARGETSASIDAEAPPVVDASDDSLIRAWILREPWRVRLPGQTPCWAVYSVQYHLSQETGPAAGGFDPRPVNINKFTWSLR
jgi:hypothetical protein